MKSVHFIFVLFRSINHVDGFVMTTHLSSFISKLIFPRPYENLLTKLNASKKEEQDPPNSLPEVTGVTLKMAFDQNWSVADLSEEKSVRFTCPESLDLVHKLRRCSDAVLVGRSTVEFDDCTLTIRRVPTFQGIRKPARVVIDPSLRICKTNGIVPPYKILTDEIDGYETIIYHSNSSMSKQDRLLSDLFDSTSYTVGNHVKLVYLPSLNATDILQDLKSKGIYHVMVEGGPVTALRFLKEGMVDRAIFIRAPLQFLDPVPSGMSYKLMDDAGLSMLDTRIFADDLVEFWVKKGTSWPSVDVDSWPC